MTLKVVEIKIAGTDHTVQMNEDDAKRAEQAGHKVIGTVKPKTASEADAKAKETANKSKTAANK